jgi:hypothetical protein
MNRVERIIEYLELEQEAPEEIPETKPPAEWPTQGAVRFRNFGVRYRDGLPLVLRHLNASFQPRQKVATVGRSGAGVGIQCVCVCLCTGLYVCAWACVCVCCALVISLFLALARVFVHASFSHSKCVFVVVEIEHDRCAVSPDGRRGGIDRDRRS